MSIRILRGDALAVLRGLPAASVHACVTRPPYFGLRSYLDKDDPDKPLEMGQEKTPDEFVAKMLDVFREVRRVLREDGICWINMGDSYNNFRSQMGPGQAVHGRDSLRGKPDPKDGRSRGSPGLKEKDLIGIPWMLAFALRAGGWYLRSALPWVKRSCMPESITDRPGSAIEHVFMLTKRPTYFFDMQAVQQKGAVPAGTRAAKGSNVRSDLKDVNGRPPEYWEYTGKRNFRNSDLFFESIDGPHGLICDADGTPIALDVNTQPFAGAHFATFPPSLIAPLIAASTSERGCCPQCGAPWERILERFDTGRTQKMADGWDTGAGAHGTVHRSGREKGKKNVPVMGNRTTGWTASCSHDAPPRPCTVLDPFGGAGTTGMVADRLGRDAILVELDRKSVKITEDRLRDDGGLFADIA